MRRRANAKIKLPLRCPGRFYLAHFLTLLLLSLFSMIYHPVLHRNDDSVSSVWQIWKYCSDGGVHDLAAFHIQRRGPSGAQRREAVDAELGDLDAVGQRRVT